MNPSTFSHEEWALIHEFTVLVGEDFDFEVYDSSPDGKVHTVSWLALRLKDGVFSDEEPLDTITDHLICWGHDVSTVFRRAIELELDRKADAYAARKRRGYSPQRRLTGPNSGSD